MKTSYYQTPRQLSDCAFVPSADPIESFGRPTIWWRICRWLTK